MIAQITSGETIAGALHYNAEKIDRGTATLLDCRNTLLVPGEEFDMRLAEQTFAPYLEANRRTKMPTFHVSLNPAPEDEPTDEMLREIAREYMERMGYGEQPYFVFEHTDIDRRHLHIVSVRIDAEGRKLPHDFEARRSMRIVRDLERRYGLYLVAGKHRVTEVPGLRKVDYAASDIRRQIVSVVRRALKEYRCPSYIELKALLESCNVGIEQHIGTVRGRDYAGIVYRALTDEGLHVGVPIKAGRIGRDVGYEALQRYYERSRQQIGQPCIDSMRKNVGPILRQCRDEEEFVRRLEQKGIDVLLRRMTDGKIFGAAYIDRRTGIVLDGLRLGRIYGGRSLEMLFHGEGRTLWEERYAPTRGTRPEPTLAEELLGLLDTRAEEERERQRRKRKRRRRTKG